MKVSLLLILGLLCPTVLFAQWDTASHNSRRLFPKHEPLLGAMGFSAAALVSMRPELHSYEEDLYDNFNMRATHKLHIDDYMQFLPSATPFVLNLCGVRGEHSIAQLSLLTACSYLIGLAAIETGKLLYKTERPDGSANTSFPSGHTFSAFTGAEIMRREYGKRYPWMTYASYGVAMLVGFMRMYNNRHWPSDVLGGAGLGVLSVSAAYLLFNQ